MSLAEFIQIGVEVSLFLAVFAVGMTATLRDAALLIRQPGQLARVILAMYVLMLAAVIVAALTLDLHPEVKIALGALAVSPVPPILSGKALKAGGESDYTTGMLVGASLLSIVFLPLAMLVCERLFAVPLAVPIREVGKQVAVGVLVPLAAGMLLRRLLPAVARFGRQVSIAAMLLLLVSALPVLVRSWPVVSALVGSGAVMAVAVFVIIGLAAGHLIGGPRPKERAVLAVACASRHPGLAIAIAHANFPEQKLVLPVVLLYLIVLAVVTTPYDKWSARRVQHPGETT